MNPLEGLQKCWAEVSPINQSFIKTSDFLSLPEDSWMDYIAGIIVKIEMLLDTIRGSKVGIYVLELMESSGVRVTGPGVRVTGQGVRVTGPGVRVTGPGVRGGAKDGGGDLKVNSIVNVGIISNDKRDVGMPIMKNKGGQNPNKGKKNARKK